MVVEPVCSELLFDLDLFPVIEPSQSLLGLDLLEALKLPVEGVDQPGVEGSDSRLLLSNAVVFEELESGRVGSKEGVVGFCHRQ